MLLEHARDIARDRVGSTRANRATNASELLLRECDGNLRRCHTVIIPKAAPAATMELAVMAAGYEPAP